MDHKKVSCFTQIRMRNLSNFRDVMVILIDMVILGMAMEDLNKVILDTWMPVSIPSTFTIKMLKVAMGKFYKLDKCQP